MRKIFFAFMLSICSSLSVNAGNVGAEHNRFLDCLLRVDPQNRLNAQTTLESLVSRCQFNPGMPTGEWLRQYLPLVPRQLTNGEAGATLADMLAPYASKFDRRQLGFLHQVDQILASQTGTQVTAQLARLYQEAARTLGRGAMDQVVVNGLDIAHSSAIFWQNRRPMPNPNNPSVQAKWWQVVAADVAGGVVGGVFGGGVGAVGLGVGCSKLVAAL